MFSKIYEKLDRIAGNVKYMSTSPLVGKTFEIWLNSVNHPDKMVRVVTVTDVDPLSGMLYLVKAAPAPNLPGKNVGPMEPDEFEGWVHPMNFLALTPYTGEIQ